MIWLCLLWQAASPPAPQWSASTDALRLSGLPASELVALDSATLQNRLLVFFNEKESSLPADAVPILGACQRLGDDLVFRPRFPFLKGYPHLAVYRGESRTWYFPFNLTPDGHRPAELSAVDPQLEVLPANQLRLYLHFSQPMRRQNAQTYISLHQADGTQVQEPFVPIPQGLWDPSGQRLTLIFHPGRIKRGVGPNQALGPPLQAGKAYTLRIDAAMPDKAGHPLAKTYLHHFQTGPPDRSKPNLEAWQWHIPAPGTRDPLSLTFDEPLDRTLCLRFISVLGPDGPVIGRAESNAGRSWQFTPSQPWLGGSYRLEISPLLEDLAGNNLKRTFETKIKAHNADRGQADPIQRPFEIKNKP